MGAAAIKRPFFFETLESNFIRKPIETNSLEFGDELISVDGIPAANLQTANLDELASVAYRRLLAILPSTHLLEVQRS